MFLLIGAGPKVKEIGEGQMMICPGCGRFSRMIPFVQKQELRLFFIPIFRFSPKYFVQSSCCGETFRLDPALGREIERGEPVTIDESDIQSDTNYSHTCPQCGSAVEPTHRFCPHCGKTL